MFGRRRSHQPEHQAAKQSFEDDRLLATVRVASDHPSEIRSLGRRDVDFDFDRVFIPSLVIDHTELVLRHAGLYGDEGFVVWAGTICGGNAHITSLVLPQISGKRTHGEISSNTTANVFTALDERDLVPVIQLHSHPRGAFLSSVDAIRPFVAVRGFISVIIPNFGFVDLADVGLWSAHEFGGPDRWRELDLTERKGRFVIDDSVIRVD